MAIKYQISSVFVLLLLASGPLQAQEEEFSFEPKYDSPLTIDLDALDEENEKIDVKCIRSRMNM